MANVTGTSPDGTVTFFDDGTMMFQGVLYDVNGNPVAQTTVPANPTITPSQGPDPTAGIISAIGNVGSTITSILTRTPVAVVNGRTVGVAGSQLPVQPQMSALTILLFVVAGVIIFKALA